jgi:hypothetical protein
MRVGPTCGRKKIQLRASVLSVTDGIAKDQPIEGMFGFHK